MFYSFLLLMTLLYDSLVSAPNNSFFLLLQAYYLCFLIFSRLFPKTSVFISLKKIFQIHLPCFNHAFWLNLITLCIIFSPCFKVCTCTKIFFSYNVSISFSTFSTIILSQKKMENHCEIYVIFQDNEHQLQKNTLCNYLHYIFS